MRLALSVAHGDNMPGYGLFELYRREAKNAGYMAPPLPDFGFAFTAGEKQSGLVRLKGKEQVSCVFGNFTGQRYSMRDGVIEVAEEDAPGLINIGYERVM
jgi:hypothetical protein